LKYLNSPVADTDGVTYTSIVKGAFFQPMNNTIIYQKSIPINFIADLPNVASKNNMQSKCSSEVQICDLKAEAEKYTTQS